MKERRILSQVTPYIPGRPIEEVKRERGLSSVYKLASNENALGPSPKACAAIRRHIANVNRYPDGACYYLRQKLAGRLRLRPEQLVFGNGSDELIFLATRAFVEPGDEVVIAQPTFLIYQIAATLAEAKIRFVPLKDVRYDLSAMRQAVTPRTKIVFIANPDNPTGTYVTRVDLEAFLSGMPPGTLVFLDEAYYEFAKGSRKYPDGRTLLGRYRNLFVARTFSKVYGLSGLRLGYGMGSVGVVRALEKVREPFNVNLLAQVAGVAALDDTGFLKKTLLFTERQKRCLYAFFEKRNIRYVPSATNFIMFDVGQDARAVAEKLMARGVIVRDMTPWGFKTCIRVTIGRAHENKRFMTALAAVMA